MTAIINGELVRNELTKNAMGGSELLAMRMVDGTIDPELLKQVDIIFSRVRPEYMKETGRPKILYLHDLPNDPESARLSHKNWRDQFAKIVFVSDWQLQYYNLVHGVTYHESVVIPNSIYPIEFKETDPDKASDQINIIYHTTPHRGLSLLVPVIDHIVQTEKNIHLDVYSSFSVYGWEERDKEYEQLFKEIDNHEHMSYHGGVSNDVVREALKKSHIFAYPSIWPETSCLAVIEAMSAKNIVVCPNFAALPETCAKWATMYQFDENLQTHANRFASVLMNVIKVVRENPDQYRYALAQQKQYFDNFFSWNLRAKHWENTIRNILSEKK